MECCSWPATPPHRPNQGEGLDFAVLPTVLYLSRALTETYRTGKTHYLDCLS